MAVSVRSFAKINLGLRIGARREDGFHELLTVYQTIGLHDLIRVSVERGRGIEIRCEDPRVPRDESNTCYRIIDSAMRAMGTKGRVIVEIEKKLPVQGGLGGASSNAVAAMLALERALKKNLPTEEWLQIAAEVGSDLPLFLLAGTVLGVGRGEQVYPLEDLPSTACVVVTPDLGVSTPKAFAEWDRLCGASTPAREGVRLCGAGTPAREGVPPQSGTSRACPEPVEGSTRRQSSNGELTIPDASDRMNSLSRALLARLSTQYSGAPRGVQGGRRENPLLELVRTGIENDFERVVFPEYPELKEGKSALERAGAKYASLSGSGSALYGLFASKEAARLAAARLQKKGWAAQATLTLTRRQHWKKFLVSSF